MSVRLSVVSQTDLTRPNVNSESFGISSPGYMAVKVWQMISHDVENVNDIEIYKNNITLWEPANCQRKLCRHYVSSVRYVNTFSPIPTLHLSGKEVDGFY